MLNEQQLWQLVLDAQKEVDELDAVYQASVADTLSGGTFDRGCLNRLTAAKVKLARLHSAWGRRPRGR